MRPLAWMAGAFVVGVGLGTGAPWRVTEALGVALGALVLAAPVRFRGRWAFACALVTATALGFARGGSASGAAERQPLRSLVGSTVTVQGRVLEAPRRRPAGGERFDLRVESVVVGGRAVKPGGTLRAHLDGPAGVAAGDVVRLHAELEAPRTAGNPGEFSYRAHLRREGIAALVRLDAPPTVVARQRLRPVARWTSWLRARLTASIETAMPEPARAARAALLGGLVYGLAAAPVDPQLEQAFRRAGLTHVLVASGTQVTLLLIAVLALARGLALPRSAAVMAGVPVVAAYALVTGLEPSILRAAVMGVIALAALAASRDPDAATALAVAAAVILLADPLQLGDVGFQLSFAATAGLLALGVPLGQRLARRLGGWLGAAIGLTLGAQLFVAPLLVYHFRQLSLVGLATNLAALPIVGLIVPLGLVASLVGLVSPTAAGWLLQGEQVLMHALLAVVDWGARLPGGFRDPFVLTPAQLAIWAAAVGVLCLAVSPPGWLRWWRRERVALALLLVAAVWSGWQAWALSTATLSVSVLDVGTGDAILVRGPTGRTLLIDGGPYRVDGDVVYDAGKERVVPALMLAGVRRLDAVLGSHRHADHLGGLASVIAGFPTGRVLCPTHALAGEAGERLLAAASQRGVTPEDIARGTVLDLGGGARAYVLWPPRGGVHDTGSDDNNSAVVVKVVYGGVSFLLASDIESIGTKLLMRHGGDISATVLKVPHQGAADSNDDAFLDAVAPRFAVISVGENNYGHPAPETLERLTRRQVTVHRTDRDGMVTYRTDGRGVGVETYGRR